MIVPAITSIHKIVPPLIIGKIKNRNLPPEEMIYFEARGVSQPEKLALENEFTLYAGTHNPEERVKKRVELEDAQARSKFVALHNYFVPAPDGPRPVTDFDDFVRLAPPELVGWFFDVIQSGERLGEAEVTNFLAPAASPSGSLSGEQAATGIAKTVT